MASQKAHHAIGIAAGVMAAAIIEHSGSGGSYHIMSILAALMAIAGGTAPDWLEINPMSRRHQLWVNHRTITHWGIAWLALLGYSFKSLGYSWWAAPMFGFAMGGVSHLFADAPNPLGIPWVFRRRSLNLWTSGRCDFILVAFSWIAAFFLIDKLFFDLVHLHWIKNYLQIMSKNLLTAL
jgi:membrane-bound metal-dependent hydrolase YbcI (DUF457 family)